MSLFSAARRELWQEKIAPALGQGATVLSARNYFSTFAYQGGGEGLDNEHIRAITSLFTHPRYMTPDHIVILTLEDENERARRINERAVLETPDTFESKDHNFQTRVNRAYVELAHKHAIQTLSCVDQNHKKSIDEIQTELRIMLGL